jgi:hypothetical protein
MIVAGHQPNYLPWLGFFYKFAHCDVFVIDDEAQFTRHNYQNRTRVKTRHGPIWLTQPVRHVGHFRSTATVEFAPGIDWRRQHLNLLWHNYARSAQREAFDLCREWLAAGSNRYMAETNIEIIAAVARTLGTHSMRRTKAAQIYRKTGNLRAIQLLLGHTKLECAVRYLGIEVDDALSIAEQVEL